MPNVKGEFSLYNKTIWITVDGIFYDLSEYIPDNVWRLGVEDNIDNLRNPEINWKIRAEISKIINSIIGDILHRDDIAIIVG